MKLSPDKTRALCETHSCYVSLSQTEGRCRTNTIAMTKPARWKSSWAAPASAARWT